MKGSKGLKENLAGLKQFQKSMETFLLFFTKNKVEFLRERAELNAPILEGDLRISIQAIPLKVGKKMIESGVTIGDTTYAVRMHEGFYFLGPVSRIQSGTVEGGVGRKYVSRVMDHHHVETEKELKRGIDKIFKRILFRVR